MQKNERQRRIGVVRARMDRCRSSRATTPQYFETAGSEART